MMPRMYAESRSPRSDLTCSCSSSNSLPSASICSSVRRWSGFSMVASLMLSSEFDLDGALGGIDAGADGLALLAGHLAVTQVADLARGERPHAGVADALPATIGQLEALLLARHEDRRAA